MTPLLKSDINQRNVIEKYNWILTGKKYKMKVTLQKNYHSVQETTAKNCCFELYYIFYQIRTDDA